MSKSSSGNTVQPKLKLNDIKDEVVHCLTIYACRGRNKKERRKAMRTLASFKDGKTGRTRRFFNHVATHNHITLAERERLHRLISVLN